jgi:glutaconyl-CoA/methylmalonyl-CoA decarboxylase subunit gamma
MKYTVKIEDQFFNVIIKDLDNYPIIACVDGVDIEIWPDDISKVNSTNDTRSLQKDAGKKDEIFLDDSPNQCSEMNSSVNNMVIAPIPGVVLSILVKAGDDVELGQELCILEAMKMRNAIRSPRVGKIKELHIMPGQPVNHGDYLIEFSD